MSGPGARFDDRAERRWQALVDTLGRKLGINRSRRRALYLMEAVVEGSAAGLDEQDVSRALRLVEAARAEVDHVEGRLIEMARGQGASWSEIAQDLGLKSRQAAEQRFLRLTSLKPEYRNVAGVDRDPQAVRSVQRVQRAKYELLVRSENFLRYLADLILEDSQEAPERWDAVSAEGSRLVVVTRLAILRRRAQTESVEVLYSLLVEIARVVESRRNPHWADVPERIRAGLMQLEQLQQSLAGIETNR